VLSPADLAWNARQPLATSSWRRPDRASGAPYDSAAPAPEAAAADVGVQRRLSRDEREAGVAQQARQVAHELHGLFAFLLFGVAMRSARLAAPVDGDSVPAQQVAPPIGSQA
jgi:hypothetical protein